MKLETKRLCLGYDDTVVVDDLNLAVPAGKITAIVGRNGSGKSTILRALARLLKPTAGAVYLDGRAIHELPTKLVAQHLAILPQGPRAPEGLTVEDLVWYGRHPYQGLLGLRRRSDAEVVEWALDVTGMTELSDRPLDTLSGGQRQRAWIATSLAQDAEYLLLDEPTTYLDVAYQLEVLELLTKLNRETGRTVVMVVHDLNHGARFADHLVAVEGGSVVAKGAPAQVLTEALVQRVFGIHCRILTDPVADTLVCVPVSLCKATAVAGGRLERAVAGTPDAVSVRTV